MDSRNKTQKRLLPRILRHGSLGDGSQWVTLTSLNMGPTFYQKYRWVRFFKVFRVFAMQTPGNFKNWVFFREKLPLIMDKSFEA